MGKVCWGNGLVEFCESLLEVPNDVISVFGANGKADSRRRDALIGQFGIGELGVRGRGRVDYEALNVCHVCQQGKDLKVVNELPSCFLAAFDFEREDGSSSVGEVLLVQLVVGMVGQAGMVNLGNMGVVQEVFNNLLVFSTWRSTRRESVSVPCRRIHALKGEMHGPSSRSRMARM